MSITPFPPQGQYPWYDQLEQWGADTQTAAENADLNADGLRADVATALADSTAASAAAIAAAGLVGAPAGEAVLAAISEGGAARGELSTAIVDIATIRKGRGLDIWNGFDSMTTNYNTWIAQIDSDLGLSATKTTHDLGEYSALPIISYKAGHGSLTVLLVAGQHGFEVYGQYAAREFFVQFATNDHPAMAALREQVTIIFVPTAVPNSFSFGRWNRNNVNINRNFPWNWGTATDTDKGAAPLDQPESIVLKSLIDNNPVGFLIDCHSMETTAPDMHYSAASGSIQGKRAMTNHGHNMWKLANPDGPTPLYYDIARHNNPTLYNWAQKYMRFDLGRVEAAVTLIECRGELGGGPTGTFARQGVRWYASFIYHQILAWLDRGLIDEPVIPFTWAGSHNVGTGQTGSISEGGRLIPVGTTFTPVKLAYTVGKNNQTFVGVPIMHPGTYFIQANVNVVAATEGGTVRVVGGLAFQQNTDGNTNIIGTSAASISLEAGERGMLTLMTTVEVLSVPDETLWQAQLLLRTDTAGEVATIHANSGAQIWVTKSPKFGIPNTLPVAD